MATYGRVEQITYQANADLSNKQYHIMRLAAAGVVDVASSSAAGSQSTIAGVLINKPRINLGAAVGIRGESKVVAGAAIAAGAPLTSNGSGRAITANSGDFTLGVAQEAAGVDGDLIRCLLRIPAVRLTY